MPSLPGCKGCGRVQTTCDIYRGETRPEPTASNRPVTAQNYEEAQSDSRRNVVIRVLLWTLVYAFKVNRTAGWHLRMALSTCMRIRHVLFTPSKLIFIFTQTLASCCIALGSHNEVGAPR